MTCSFFIAALLRAAFLLIALAPLGRGQILIGTGEDSSFLVLEAEAFGDPLVFEYFYDYDPANPLDGYGLLTAIDSALPDLEFTFLNFGTPEEPNYFLNVVTYEDITLTNTGAPSFSPFWAQWVSGGEAGFPTAEPVPSGEWSFGSGVSAPYRFVQPGSWDGFIYNDGVTPPMTAPVPEPSGVLLVSAGICVFIIRRFIHAPPRIHAR